MKRFLIIGGGIENKGAEAMLFIAASKLKSRFPGCKVFCDVSDRLSDPLFVNSLIRPVHIRWDDAPLLSVIKNALKIFFPKKERFRGTLFIRRMSGIFDISGYALASIWPESATLFYLKRITKAKQCKVPVFLLPQSFGPFDYPETRRAQIIGMIKESLDYCSLICPRDPISKEAVDSLRLHAKVHECKDLVLCSAVDGRDVLTDQTLCAPPVQACEKSVALIPSVRVSERLGQKEYVSLNKRIISFLTKKGYHVYIICHSEEDMILGKLLFEKCLSIQGCSFVQNDLNHFQFNVFVSRLDFIVASRYHAIVHAYRQGVPAAVIGWASKYVTLMEEFSQSDLFVRVEDAMIVERILHAIDNLRLSYEVRKAQLQMRIRELTREDCFDFVSL